MAPIMSETARLKMGLAPIKVTRYMHPMPTTQAAPKKKVTKAIFKDARPSKGLVDSCGNRWLPMRQADLPDDRLPKNMAHYIPRELCDLGAPSGVRGKAMEKSLAKDVLQGTKVKAATNEILNEL